MPRLRAAGFLQGGELPELRIDRAVGALQFSKKELRRHRAEERNDHTLLVATVACCCGGVLWGVLLSSSTFGAIMAGIGYGIVGLLIGVPIGFAINATRGLLG